MIHTNDQMLQEIISRSLKLKKQREKRVIHALAGSSCALCMMMAVFLWGEFGNRSSAGSIEEEYGAFLLSPAAGGYILVALIAFVIGIIITIIAYKYKHR